MPKTINFGTGSYQVPDTLDQGNDLFTLLDDMFVRLINHSHTGVDSKSISLNISKDTTDFIKNTHITWNNHLAGAASYNMFKATLTMPGGATYEGNIRRYFYQDSVLLGAWKEFYPSTEKIDANTYYIFSNDDNINIRVVTA